MRTHVLLTEDQLIKIYHLKNEGLLYKEIDEILGKGRGTASRGYSILSEYLNNEPKERKRKAYVLATRSIRKELRGKKITQPPIPVKATEVVSPSRYNNLEKAFETLQETIITFIEEEIASRNKELIVENAQLKEEQKTGWVDKLRQRISS